MKIKTTRAAAASPGSKVKPVLEAKAEFKIEFEDGSSTTFRLPIRALPLRYETRITQSNISGKSCTVSTTSDDSPVTYC
jgi:hypothetical protein